MARFVNSNVSQGRVAAFSRSGGIFNIRLTTTHLPWNLPVKRMFNRLRFAELSSRIRPVLLHTIIIIKGGDETSYVAILLLNYGNESDL